MPDVDSTLRHIAEWKRLIATDLTSAFYQIHLAKDSMKYCGVATPFKGVRVYVRYAMGMPGSETALEELMCRVLGSLLQDGVVAKIADDLYCGLNTPLSCFRIGKRFSRPSTCAAYAYLHLRPQLTPRLTPSLDGSETLGPYKPVHIASQP